MRNLTFAFAVATAAALAPGAASLAAPAAAAAAATTSADYMAQAGASDLYEIQAANIALKRSKSPQVKQFAQHMVADHTKSTDMVKQAAGSAGLPAPAPPTLDAEKESMISALNSASAADFDKTYLDQQKKAHDEALALHNGYAKSGDNPALKKTAGEIVKAVRLHINMLHQMKAGG